MTLPPSLRPPLRGLPVTQGPLVIAEAGVNHNGSLDLAMRLIDAAAEAGANAVKFQTFVPELVASPEARRADYQLRADEGNTQLDMIRSLALSGKDFARLSEHCAARGILFLSTPFDRPSADLLVDLGIPAIKVPSGEIANLPFLTYLAGLKRPLIISTGMATLGEVERAVQTVEDAGNTNYALLHCTSNYPAAPETANLRAIATLAQAFRCPVGYSDHTVGISIALAATALGATIIEKHLTLDRNLPGPDHRASLEPSEMKALVAGCREVQAALGSSAKRPVASERPVAEIARRSLAAARDLPAGCCLQETDVIELRPGTGIPPREAPLLFGRRLKRPLPAFSLLHWNDIE